MPDIGPPWPDPLDSSPRDPSKHWSILDQTKAEFKASGRSGIVIIVEPDDAYRATLANFLARYNTTMDMNDPKMKHQLVLQHDTQAKGLYEEALGMGLYTSNWFLRSSDDNFVNLMDNLMAIVPSSPFDRLHGGVMLDS